MLFYRSEELSSHYKFESYRECSLANLSITQHVEDLSLTLLNHNNTEEALKEALFISDSLLEMIPDEFLDVLTNLCSLTITNSTLPKFDQNFFRNLDYLAELTIEKSNLKRIESFTFSNLKNLTDLILTNNEISEIEENAFAGLENLLVLSLKSNNLVHLKKSTFTSLLNLRKLNLSNNRLKFLDFSLKSNLKLGKLLLHDNAICFIKEDFFDNLKNHETVDLKNNLCINEVFHYSDDPLIYLKEQSSVCFNNFDCVMDCEIQQYDEYFFLRKYFCKLSKEVTALKDIHVDQNQHLDKNGGSDNLKQQSLTENEGTGVQWTFNKSDVAFKLIVTAIAVLFFIVMILFGLIKYLLGKQKAMMAEKYEF